VTVTRLSASLTSIGLPVRNAGSTITGVVESILAQDHPNLEIVISDNASTDDTEEVCRKLAQSDSRIAYHRQAENIGLLNNFRYVIGAANGEFFRWIGDDDRLDPSLVSRCLEVFADDPRLILVTTTIAYAEPDGSVRSTTYEGDALRSDDPVVRLTEMLDLLNRHYALIDPIYGMIRRAAVVSIPRRNILREDEVFATKLALAGPWAHIPEVLAERSWEPSRIGGTARKLGVPSWQARFANTLMCREILDWLPQAGLTPAQQRQAATAVRRMYLRRQWVVFQRRSHKLGGMVTRRSAATGS
jgi:glycosyltransferase involved in cell wall biosynthesis